MVSEAGCVAEIGVQYMLQEKAVVSCVSKAAESCTKDMVRRRGKKGGVQV